MQERIFTKLFEAAEVAKFTKAEYDSYEESLKVYRDWINTIETAKIKSKEEGREEGLKEGEKIGIEKGEKIGIKGEKIGIEKGEKKKAMEMAQSLKAKGVAISIIAECSGLSEEEINSL